VPLRRYRVDPGAYRELLRRLDQGALVGLFVEGERAPLGAYQGVQPHVARMLARLAVPVIPLGISGNYDAGPRWADRLRIREVRIRAGPPVATVEGDSQIRLDRAITELLDDDPHPLWLDGLERGRLARVVWRCPRCLDEPGWDAAGLRCAACGATWAPTARGRFRGPGGAEVTLAELAGPVWRAPETGPLAAAASASREDSLVGPIRPLRHLGQGRLVVAPSGVSFGAHAIPIGDLRTTSTERADTLQLASATTMWQFRLREGSAFRMRRALDAWRGA
jgi:hypothetical protein